MRQCLWYSFQPPCHGHGIVFACHEEADGLAVGESHRRVVEAEFGPIVGVGDGWVAWGEDVGLGECFGHDGRIGGVDCDEERVVNAVMSLLFVVKSCESLDVE